MLHNLLETGNSKNISPCFLVFILSITKYTLLLILKVSMEHTEIRAKVIQTDQAFIITPNKYVLNTDLTLNAPSKSSRG